MHKTVAAAAAAALLFSILPGAPAAAADHPVDPAYLEGLEWRMIGPWRGGRVTAVAGHVSDQNFYVIGATGGVWITRDGGHSWTAVSDKTFTTASVGAVDIADSDPNVIVVGMGESPVRGVASSHGDGVYRSTDGGKTWTHLGLPDSRHIGSVQIHPEDPETFWVAVQGAAYAPTEDRGVYKTTDGGKSFKKVLYVNENTGAVDLKYDAANPRILYAAMWDWQRLPYAIRSGGPGSGIWRSMDGGETWEELSEGLPEPMGKIGVAPSPAKPGRVWAVVEAKDKGGVYRSEDYGKSWTLTNGTRRVQARSWYYMHIFADPVDENTVYVLNAPFMKSVDGGKTFFETAKATHGDHHDLWINPNNPKILIDGNDGGGAVSFDGGETFSTQHNQPHGQFYRVNTDNRLFYRVYGGQQDNTTVGIRSFGLDGAIGRDDYMRVGGCESGHVAFNPDDPRLIYSGCYLGQIEEFDAETETVRDVRIYPAMQFGVPAEARKYRFNWNSPILVSRHDPTVIYHAGNVLVKSSDRGVSWTEISPDLTRDEEDRQGAGGFPITNEVSENYNTLMAVAESPFDAAVLWAGSDDGLVHITRDGGGQWQDITPKEAGQGMVNAIEASPHEPGTAYIAFTRYKYNDHTPLIFKTENYGRSWKNLAKDIPAGHWVRVVREDPARKGLLYAGTELGIFVSWNDGRDWQPLMAGELPVVPITDIKVQGNDLAISTQGRAFWILDDISPLRQMSEEVQQAEAHLFAPKSALYIDVEGGSFPGRSDNPPVGAMLYYTLKQAPDLAETTIMFEIRDADGNLVRTLESDKEKGVEGGGQGPGYALPAKKGLNRAVWDLRHDALAPVLEGQDFVIAARGGNKIGGWIAAPGNYTVRLSVGDATVEQPLELAFDPRQTYAETDLAEQQRLVAATASMIEEFQGSLSGLRKVREQAKLRKDLAEKAGKEELADAAEAVVKAVNDWEKGIISTEREFFQDVLNWPDKLFTDLQFLYGDLDDAIPQVTNGMKQRFQDLDGRFDDAMAARDAIVEGAIAAFNAAFKAQDEPALAVPAFRPEE